jgi:uncharacterized protein YggE
MPVLQIDNPEQIKEQARAQAIAQAKNNSRKLGPRVGNKAWQADKCL